jgi:hypothetical protein
MVNQASTVMAIEYQMILDNIAMFTTSPDVLPWHVRIDTGTVQVNDEGGMPELGIQWGGTPGFTRGVEATRSITEQWGASALTDPLVVKALQDVYRQAVGLPAEPDPKFLKQEVAARAKEQAAKSRADESAPVPEELPPGKVQPSAPPANLADTPLEIVRPDFEVPTGWYHVGTKNQVPVCACFVGHCGERYVWVTPEGVADLSRFTLIVMAITKRHAADTAIAHGLVFTR